MIEFHFHSLFLYLAFVIFGTILLVIFLPSVGREECYGFYIRLIENAPLLLEDTRF